MKILALHDGGSGCMYYRVRVPLEALAANGYDVTFFSVNLDPDDGTGSFQEPVKYGHGVRKKTGPAVRSVMDGYDVIIGQRVNTHEGLVGWRGARGPFNRLVYETDDDVFHVETTNFGAYKLFSRNDTQDAVAHAAEVSDLVTVSTEPLRQIMSEFSPNVVTAHNCLPDWAPDLVRRPYDRPCVGWGGGGSHAMDLALIAKPVRAFLRRFPGWDCRLRGADFRLTLAHRRVYFDRWTSVNANPEKYYRGLRMDVGVAPLAGTKFDQSKSFIKVLEYAALGIPSVASHAGPYPEFIRHGENGFLAETQKDWLEYLSLLASDDALRDKLGARAREDARAWTIGHHWRTWAGAYEAMFTRRQ